MSEREKMRTIAHAAVENWKPGFTPTDRDKLNVAVGALMDAGYRDAAAVRAETIEACAKVACIGCAEHWPLEMIGGVAKHRKPFSMGYTHVQCHAASIRALAPKGESDDR